MYNFDLNCFKAFSYLFGNILGSNPKIIVEKVQVPQGEYDQGGHEVFIQKGTGLVGASSGGPKSFTAEKLPKYGMEH